MKQHHKHREKQGGFTLVELIVVIAIIGILAALVVPSVTGYIERAQAVTCQHNIQSAAQMLDQVVAQDMGSYTNDDLTPLLGDIIDNNGGYFSKPIKCPSGGTYTYSASWAPNGSLQCTITCSKHSGIEGSKTVGKQMDTSALTHMDKIIEMRNKEKLTPEEIELLSKLLGNNLNNISYISNDNIRKVLIKEYEGTWPKLEDEIIAKSQHLQKRELYVQPYVSVKNSKYEGTLIYAGKAPNNNVGGKWEAYAIYNPTNDTWYEHIDGSYYDVNKLYANNSKDTVESILASLNDTTQWIPIN